MSMDLRRGGARIKDVSQIVSASLTGPLLPLATKALSGTPSWSIVSQSADNNLAITGAMLGPIAPIGAGVSQWAVVRADAGNDFIGFKVTLTGAGIASNPTLDFSVANNSQYLSLLAA